jgi:hypothetical protein
MRYVGIIETRAALDPIGFHFRFRGLLSFAFWGAAGFTKIKSMRVGFLA